MKEKEYFTNGEIEAIGKVITCSNYDKRYSCNESNCKKIGKWVYYYQGGITQRIENYKRIKDCSKCATPDGIWQYYSEKGILIKEEEYKDGILWKADISKYYFNEEIAEEILVRNGIYDTIKYEEVDSLNLVKNGNFGLYFGQPQLIIKNGQNQIEAQIPFWITPNSNTPDYYNQFRRLNKVPDNLTHDYNATYNYVGIILYHKPTGGYAEYISGELKEKLKPDQNYCIKIRIRLSQNSGYYIDRLGAYFSNNVPHLPNTIEKQKDLPQVFFNRVMDNREAWVTFCALYTANGGEKYITIGRFSSIPETRIQEITPLNFSEGELNQSAYYLIDNVELYENPTHCCEEKPVDFNPETIDETRIDFDSINLEDSLNFDLDKTFVLSNIFFEFDKSTLLNASMKELEKLRLFLVKNNTVSVIINGHTDNIGTEEYNYNLSLSRAKAVVIWLTEHGIETERLKYKGFGATKPVCDNSTKENRAKNRRVEFKMTKTD